MDYPDMIKRTGWNLFATQGIKNTSIEAICKELQISKKTFYKYFSNKEQLILSAVRENFTNIEEVVFNSSQKKQSPMTIFIQLIRQIRHMVPQDIHALDKEAKSFYPISPNIIADLPSLYPEIWQEIDQFRHKLIERIATLLENEKEDYIKETIHVKVISRMLFAIIETIVQPKFLNEYHVSLDEAVSSVTELLFTGIIKEEKQQEVMEQLKIAK